MSGCMYVRGRLQSTCLKRGREQRQPITTGHREQPPLSLSPCRLTSGSAMMMRIFRSDTVVKLANRLLRTYSPGLLSGSTLMGIMAGGPFSPWGQQTGGMGGLLYPFPTGEAAETTQKAWDGKPIQAQMSGTGSATDLFTERDHQIEHCWEVSKHGHKVPNMLSIPEGDCPKGTGLPQVCSLSYSEQSAYGN